VIDPGEGGNIPKYKPAGRKEQYKPAGPARKKGAVKKKKVGAGTYKGKTWVGMPKGAVGKAGSRGMTKAAEKWISTHYPSGKPKKAKKGA